MHRLPRLGRTIFSVGAAGLGLQHLITGNFGPGLEAVPAWVVGRTELAYLTGLALCLGALGVLAAVRRRQGAVLIAIVFSALFVFLQWPLLVYHVTDPNVWTTVFETLALSGAAWTLVTSTAAPGENPVPPALGRLAYGLALPAFGILHFKYAHFVGTLIPAWIPLHTAWAVFIGICFVAAGLAIVTRIRARLAATLLGAMFGSWVVLLHIPLVITSHGAGGKWTSLFVATMMCGGAWMVSAYGAGTAA